MVSFVIGSLSARFENLHKIAPATRFSEKVFRAHFISYHTIQDLIPQQEISALQQSKFLLYSEDLKFVDTAILGSLLVATPHIDGSDLELSTGGN